MLANHVIIYKTIQRIKEYVIGMASQEYTFFHFFSFLFFFVCTPSQWFILVLLSTCDMGYYFFLANLLHLECNDQQCSHFH
jgi:hypothetical protein